MTDFLEQCLEKSTDLAFIEASVKDLDTHWDVPQRDLRWRLEWVNRQPASEDSQ